MSRNIAIALALFAVAGCRQRTASECARDDDCEVGFGCEAGVCRCQLDSACGAGSYCNPYGVCQERPPCVSNADCAEAELCNSDDPVTGGTCVPAGSCGGSEHCPFGSYCHKAEGATLGECVSGCEESGDCRLGEVCVEGACVAAGHAGDCVTCPVTPKPDAKYCDYGEACAEDGTCRAVAAPTALCSPCSGGSSCGSSDFICLIDQDTVGNQYCAPKCTDAAQCPNGYDDGGCGGLIVVTDYCSDEGTCASGAPCITVAESSTSYCGCNTDADCTTETAATCNPTSHTCSNAGLPCSSDAECALTCQQIPAGEGTVGVCLTVIGVCGKNRGVTCDTLTTEQADCRRLQ